MLKNIIKSIFNLIFGKNADVKLYMYFNERKTRHISYDFEHNHMNKYKKIYTKLLENSTNEEEKEIARGALNLINENNFVGASAFPFNWAKEVYNPKKIKVYLNDNCDKKYVLLNNKKLYFPSVMHSIDLKRYYNLLQIIEQHPKSAHKYTSENFFVEDGDIVADIGACEGNFSLENIDKIKKLYLFEPIGIWVDCLRETFKDYSDKVEIIQKKVSDINDDENITLDEFFKDKEQPTFLKADIEGFEEKMIAGAKDTLANSCKLKVALCVYHREDDDILFTNILNDLGYISKVNNGKIAILEEDRVVFRSGLIRAKREWD